MKPIYMANLLLIAVVVSLSCYLLNEKPKADPPPPRSAEARQANDDRTALGTKDRPEQGKPDKAKDGPMPRRLLAISVNNYLYANPVLYGSAGFPTQKDRDRHDFCKAVERLADGWLIPKEQRYYVTDGPLDDSKVDYAHPPLKKVITETIDKFLNTCRAQDRIVIVFAGHALEKDGAAYLVPLEGEFEDLASLIPLKDIYAKLGKCPAQEKLVIFDVCRFFPGGSVERPTFGKMTKALETALHNCPEGVTVWTTCSAGQFSYEDEYAELALVGLGKPIITGSYFFSIFFPASQRGVFDKREHGAGKHLPADSLPITPAFKFISEKTEAAAMELQKKSQTPKSTPRARKEWLPYDPHESPPARFNLSSPPAIANRAEVAAIFGELALPPVKALLQFNYDPQSLESFPFAETQMKDYLNDGGPTFAEIAKAPEKFARDFPIRAVAVEAIVEMRKLKNDGTDFPEEFNSPITAYNKRRIADHYQRPLAVRQGIFDELKEKLETAANKRDREKSKRWLAHFDYADAQAGIRSAYIHECHLALAQVIRDTLPNLDPKIHRGWVLSAVETMQSLQPRREQAKRARKLLADIAREHPGTPWAVLAKQQRHMILGLRWEPLLKSVP